MTQAAVHVFVVVAHPDDAEIALGGAIARWSQAGIRVTVGCCAVSEQSPDMSVRRRLAAEEAATVLGHELTWLAPGDVGQVEDIPEHRLVGLLDRAVKDLDVDVVITHSEFDSHADHRRVATAAHASSRTWPDTAHLQLGVNEHRTSAYGRFVPSLFIPVEAQLERKRTALAAYSYEGQGYRPLDAKGIELRSRALGSQCAETAAEGLTLVRAVAGSRGGRGLAHLLTGPEGSI